MTELFLWCVGAHFLADFSLQSPWMADMKRERWYIMFGHVAIWTGTCCVPLKLFGVLTPWKVGMLFVGHLLCDLWKSRYPKEPRYWRLIYVDQGIHVVQLGLACVL